MGLEATAALRDVDHPSLGSPRRGRWWRVLALFLLLPLLPASPAGAADSDSICFAGELLDLGPNYSPQAMVGADVNGDGLTDLVASGGSQDAGGVHLLLGLEGGRFSDWIVVPDSPGSSLLAAGDFDEDDHVDLVVHADAGLAVLLGNGDATFQPGVVHPVAASPQDVQAADLDGDGHLDLVAASDGFASILFGDGNGSFASAQNEPVAPVLRRVAASDLNGDGLLDLVVTADPDSSSDDAIYVLVAQTPRVFGAATKVRDGIGSRSLLVADLTQDGIPDIAYSSGTDVHVLPGRGDGTFVAPVEGPFGSLRYASGFSHLRAADMNADGRTDLVGSSGVLLADETGGFESPSHFSSVSAVAVVADDFDGDGVLDVAVAGGFQIQGVAVRRGLGDGRIEDIPRFETGAGVTSFNSGLAVADFDGDGRLDAVTAISSNRDGATASVLLGDGAGGLGAPLETRVPSGSFSSRSPMVARDLDGDGWLDLVLPTSDGLAVLVGRGDGSFVPTRTPPAGDVGAVGTGDFDGDGVPDLVASDASREVLYRLRGLGGGRFGPAVEFPAVRDSRTLAVADLDADGHLDVALANEYSISVHLGTGDGGFDAPVFVEVPYAAALSLVAGDFDGDGIPDLAGVGRVRPVVLYRGMGDGHFEPPTFISEDHRHSADSVVAADVDGDGALDLVTAAAGGAVGLLQGNGDGTFRRMRRFLSGGDQGFGVAVADLTGDGRPELIQDNLFGDIVVILNCSEGPLPATIDIRPRDPHNVLSLLRPRPVWVALLGSEHFDVRDVDRRTLAFGPAGAPALETRPRGRRARGRDLNGDGFPDLTSRHATRESGIAIGDSRACLRGELRDGTPFEGCDAIQTTVCGDGFELAAVVPMAIWMGRRRRRG